MQFTVFNSLAFADVPKSQMNAASTIFSTFFQLSMGLGIAVGALLLRISMAFNGTGVKAVTGDFQLAFLMVAAIAVVALLDTLRLSPDAGEAVLQRNN